MAKAFSITYQAVYQWSWADVFAYRAMRIDEYHYNKRLNEIRNRKQ
jgi:hypothetical protein